MATWEPGMVLILNPAAVKLGFPALPDSQETGCHNYYFAKMEDFCFYFPQYHFVKDGKGFICDVIPKKNVFEKTKVYTPKFFRLPLNECEEFHL